MYDVTRAALDVARKYPVFPVRIKDDGSKAPALSNKKLGVKSGEGGYKAASQDAAQVEWMFQAAGPECEIGVPMQMAGLVCLDFDTHKGGEAEQWVKDHWDLLKTTRCHRTMSGGRHFIFLDPGDVQFPGQVAGLPDAEVKHKGFIVWPGPSGKYTVDFGVEPKPMSAELLDLLDGREGKPAGQQRSSFTPNDMSDDQLVERVLAGDDYHGSFATLLMRGARSGMDYGQLIEAARNMLRQSGPQDSKRRERRDQLLDELAARNEDSEIGRLARGAVDKHREPDLSDVGALLREGPELLNVNRVMARTTSKEQAEPQPVPERSRLQEMLTSRIAPRQWLHGNYLIKGHMTMTSAPGGMGKSTAIMTELLEVAAQQNITDQQLWRAASVLYLNGEDPHDELVRRLVGTVRHHGIDTEALQDRFDFHSGRDHDLVLVRYEDGEIVVNDSAVQLIKELIETRGAEVVCLDPLSSFHECNENSNEDMNRLMAVIRALGHETGVSFHIVHHSVKDALTAHGKAMGAEQARGASALLDACRVVRTMRLMTQAEREEYDLAEGAEHSHVVVSIGKGNLSRRRVGYTFTLGSYDLENGDETYPDGDSVAVVELFDRPRNPASDDIDDLGMQSRAARALLMLPTDKRRAKGERGPVPKSWTGWYLIQQLGLNAEKDRDQRVAEGLLQRFVEQGLLRKVEQHNPRSGRGETIYEPVQEVIQRVAEQASAEPLYRGRAE